MNHHSDCILNVECGIGFWVSQPAQSSTSYIGRDMAARLALLMDSGELVVEGALTGTKGEFQCPIGPKLFGIVSHPEKWALRSKLLGQRLPVQELDRAEAARQKRLKQLEKQQGAPKHAEAKTRKQGRCGAG